MTPDARLPHDFPTLPGVGAPAVELAMRELARRLAHLRTTLARLVGVRRCAGVPVAQVIAEVQALMRFATAREAWPDPDGTLATLAVRWALAEYHARRRAPAHDVLELLDLRSVVS